MDSRARVFSPSRREAGCEWGQVSLLAVNLLWTTLCLGGFRADTMVVTATLSGLLLAFHLASRAVLGARRFHPAGWLLVPFLVYAAANVIWVTPVPWLGWRDWLGWAQTITIFWVVLNGVRSPRGRATVFAVLVGLALTAVVLAAFQRFVAPHWLMLGRTQSAPFIGRASGPFGIPNSLAGFLILLLPPVLAVAFRRGASPVQRVFWGYAALVLSFGLGLTISRGAWLSLGAVLVVWPLFSIRRSLLRRVAIAMAVLLLLVTSATVLSSALPHVHERLAALRSDRGEISRSILWRGAWRIFEDQPVWGGGAGSFNVRFEPFRPASFQDDPLWAHNEYLNLLCDYGVAGALLCLGATAAIVALSFRARRRSVPTDAAPGAAVRRATGWWPVPSHALAAGLVAFALQAVVDFHLKIPALALAFAVVAALWVQANWPTATLKGSGSRWNRVTGAVAAAIVGVATLAVVRPIYESEALRNRARESIDEIALLRLPADQWRARLDWARAWLRRAVQLDPANAAAWADLAYALTLSNVPPSSDGATAREAGQAADRAVAGSAAVAEFWIRRGVALDLQNRGTEAGRAFVTAVTLAPARADVWYQQAYHLARRPAEADRALAAVEFCLRLDPANREAQALRARLADRNPVR